MANNVDSEQTVPFISTLFFVFVVCLRLSALLHRIFKVIYHRRRKRRGAGPPII